MTSLDEWHLRVNGTFLRRNWERSEEQICLHLVELVGGIARASTGRAVPDLDVPTIVVKSLAWWFALCGKHRIKSVQQMIWSKFPGICPFCLQSVHDAWTCRDRRSASPRPDWSEVARIARERAHEMPNAPGQWQEMFARIYPITDYEDYGYSARRLGEELGELAESVRAREAKPGHFYNEAADVFAWLLRVKSVHEFTTHQVERKLGEDLDYRLQQTYGIGCPDCNQRLCECLPINPDTLDRLSLDMPLTPDIEAKTLTSESDLAQIALTLAQRRLSVGGTSFVLTLDVVEELRDGLHRLREMVAAGDASRRSIATSLQGEITSVRDVLDRLADAQRISEDGLEALIEAVVAAPSEERTTVLAFLNGTASGLWTAVAAEVLARLA